MGKSRDALLTQRRVRRVRQVRQVRRPLRLVAPVVPVGPPVPAVPAVPAVPVVPVVPVEPLHFVYLLRCADQTLYTGYARDPEKRVAAHNRGQGAKYTAGRRPVLLIYVEAFPTRGEALSREHAIKQLSRTRKLALLGARSDRTARL